MGKATPRMIEFAKAIASRLDLDEPDYNDFDEVHDFIEENKDDYYEDRRMFG